MTAPAWLKRPSVDDLMNYYPADGDGLPGKVQIRCVVTARGTLDQCKVAEETPPGHGFGASALMMSSLFLMRPPTIDGVPVGGGMITIPISFQPFDRLGAWLSQRIRVVPNPAWAATPSAADMLAAFPVSAVGKVARARTVQRCRVVDEGSLGSCETVAEQPSGYGFAAAARKLTKRFRVRESAEFRKGLKGTFVDVPFEFRDPTQPAPPLELINPEWLTAGGGDIFPGKAAKAGVNTGVGILKCNVTRDGRLSPCTVIDEKPAGYDFGITALAVANVMTMNPWMRQGFPVDGATVTLSLRLNLEDAAPAAPTAQPAPH